MSSISFSAVEAVDDGVLIRVRAQPKASRDSIVLEADGRIRVALTAPPVDGAANAALLKYLARILGVKKKELSLRSGERSRDKTLFLRQSSVEFVLTRLEHCRP